MRVDDVLMRFKHSLTQSPISDVMETVAQNVNGSTRITDGALAFSGGCNSTILPTYQSDALPEGLPKNQLSWAGNCIVRDGGIAQRPGVQPIVQGAPWSGLFQGAHMYEPEGADPYIIIDIAGRTYQVRVDTDNSVHDITTHPRNPTVVQHWFIQGESFMVFQDGISEPQVWDGTTMRLISAMGGTPPFLPIGTAMSYYMGHIFVTTGNGSREYMGGDIVGGASGTVGRQFKDAILHSTENTYLAGGGSFIVPSNAGIIRALAFSAELDTALGQGRLYVFTRNSIYALNVPPDRTEWVAATANKLPLQTVAQIRFGSVGDRPVVQVNGDLWYQTLEPGIRSLTLAVRYFQQWANVQLSSPELRVMQLSDRSLLRYATGILFDNYLLQSALPEQRPQGVIHKALVPLDFNPISTLQDKKPPSWLGVWEGLNVMQLLEADFGGRQRAFAVVLSDVSGKIEIWELTQQGLRDNGDNRITSFFETGGFFSDSLFRLKELESAEFWFDNLQGAAQIKVEYRGDGDCWHDWITWRECSARNSTEDLEATHYPTQTYCPSFRAMRALPKPPVVCQSGGMNRPSNLAYTFQLRVTIKGTIRVRGLVLHAKPIEKPPFYGLVC
jgi:hypothetical protein